MARIRQLVEERGMILSENSLRVQKETIVFLMAAAAIGFDVYGTLVDPLGISEVLRRFVGEDAERVAQLWRTTQLEYTWRRSLMGIYAPFSICTAQALEFAARSLGHRMAPEATATLLQAYRALPAFSDAAAGLEQMRRAGHRMVAFSNGEADYVRAVLTHAGVMEMLADVVSVDEVKIYKPAPTVYRHLAERMDMAMEDTWLVSSNPFDVIGAKAAGLKTAWVRRNSRAMLDPWAIEPDLIVADLVELSGQLGEAR
jgi:2-haloacid dehalogenase